MDARPPTSPIEKQCPACAETVRGEAAICRFCGYNFSSGVVPAQRSMHQTAATQTTNGFAIASMVLGIVWLWWIGSVLALIFGYIARRDIDASQGRQGGRGMAIAGIVLGWIGVGILALVVVGAVITAAGSSAF